jgi:hypothetical protein
MRNSLLILDTEWEETSVPVEATSTATYWSDAPVAPTSTPVAASTWVDVSAAPSKPVASYTKSAPVADYTGGAATLTGAGVAGFVAVAALLL